MRNKAVLVSIGIFSITVFASPTSADGWRLSKLEPNFTIEAKLWQSRGESDWNHNAAPLDPAVGNPTSRLDYAGVDATVIELRGRSDFNNRFFLELGFGLGQFRDGKLIDDDFLSAFGARAFGAAVPGEHLFSRTSSEIDGDNIHFIDLVFGREIVATTGGSRVSLFGEYMYWSEKYRANGVVQNICTVPDVLCAPAGFSGFQGVDVIINETRWNALFVGVDGLHAFNRRFSLSARLAYSPLARLDNDDFHLLRTDLGRPGFHMSGSGHGYSFDVNASYHFTDKLVAHLGFRYWRMRLTNEANGWQVFPLGSPSTSAELNQFVTDRKGITAAVSYRLGGAGSRETD